MLSVVVGDASYELEDDSVEEILSRVAAVEPADHDNTEAAQSLDEKLRASLNADEPAVLDQGELAVLGVVIEAWAVEVGTDAPDVEALRQAISDELS
jgi:hypothetical protein